MMPANAVIDELVSRWDEARARGQETSVEELCRDHPELLEPVGRIIALRKADYLRSATGDAATSPMDTPAEISSTVSFSGTLEWQDGLRPPQEHGEIGRLGPFRVIRLLGAGGMGTVYEAIDTQLGRPVALKVMQAPRSDSEVARARFLREARTAAALEHDHVVSIYQVGEDNGVLYLAMPLLRGQTLRSRIKQNPPLTLAEILRIGREIAEGLAAAHERELIHRDVKPGNIWLEEGSGRVKILDFGLARTAQEAKKLTQHGTIVGTPAYLAPEQARGKEEFDCRGDLFSLGVILYRMVTGRLPFPGDHTAAMLLALLTDDPIPPRQINPAISPALDALILRLLAKDPEKRFQSARLVVEAIRELEQTETHAPRSSLGITVDDDEADSPGPRREFQPSARFRFLVMPMAALGALVLGIAAGLAIRPRLQDLTADPVLQQPAVPDRLESARNEETVVRDVPQPPGVAPRSPAPTPGPSPTPPALPTPLTRTRVPGPARNVAAIEPWPTPPPDFPRLPGLIPAPEPLRGKQRWQVETRSPRDAVLSLSWSPDRQRLACAAGERVVRIYEAESLNLVALLAGHTGPVFSVDWSPDGRTLATGSSDGTVRLWSASGVPGLVLQGHSGSVWCVRWNHDGSRLASASNDRSVRVWSAEGSTLQLLEHPAAVVAVAWNPESTALVSAAANVLHLWNADGTPGPLLKGHTQTVHSVAWSATGTQIASASDDQTVRVWDADGTPGLVLEDHDKIVRAVAWSPDGKRLATAGGDSKVRIYWFDGTPGPVLSGLSRTVDSVAWSPDGKRLAAGSSAAEIRIWDSNGRPGPSLTALRTSSAVAFSGDGTRIVSALAGHPSLLLWGPDDLPGKVLKGRSRQVRSLAWSPDGSQFAATDADASVQLWYADGTRGLSLKGHHDDVNGVAWSPDGKHLASASNDATVRLWGADGRPGPVLKGHEKPVVAVRYSPDGKRLVTAGDDASVRFWRPDGTLLQPPLKSGSPVGSLAWSPDGRRLAVGTLGTVVQLWNTDPTGRLSTTSLAGNAQAIAWHPDGHRLATAGPRSVVRLWDADGREGPAISLRLPPGDWREAGVDVAWSPRGDRLLAASRHGLFWAWCTQTLAPEWVAVQTSPVSVTLFSPDGRALRSDPIALKDFVYMLERPDRGITLLTHQEFEETAAGKK
jgi:WD40 repeat protein/serine/threonine protein kinase